MIEILRSKGYDKPILKNDENKSKTVLITILINWLIKKS